MKKHLDSPIKNSIRKKLLKVSLHPDCQFHGDEEEFREQFWAKFSRGLTKQQRAYLGRYPEFVREVIFESISIEDSQTLAKEFLLSRANWEGSKP